MKPEISIVIPCYNEEPTLPYLANTLRGLQMRKLFHKFDENLQKQALECGYGSQYE